MSILYSFRIDQFQFQHSLHMPVVERIVGEVMSQLVDLGKREGLFVSDFKYAVAIILCEEFAFVVQQFECIPLSRVVAGRNDDAPVGFRHGDSQFGGWCGGQSDVYDIKTHAEECAADHTAHHLARDARIASDHDFTFFDILCLTYEGSVRSGELHDIQRIERIACGATNSTSNT